ncbi:MAG: molybdenum cofactor biosynthesis protein MoaE [bacterium]|nr:molybdenum cofactor biosynthesis protein MoaE [bacterium]
MRRSVRQRKPGTSCLVSGALVSGAWLLLEVASSIPRRAGALQGRVRAVGLLHPWSGGRGVADAFLANPLPANFLAPRSVALAGGCRVGIVHRLGEVPVGEASVVIGVAAPHRQAAYEASRTALERLKHEVPIWKREHYADGVVAWREEEPLSA